MKTLLLFLLITCSTVNAQIAKFQAEFFNLREYNDSTKTFNEWEGWEDSDVIIIFDLNKRTLTIYSEYEQEYTIVSKIEPTSKHNVYRLDAIDKKGYRCSIESIYYETGKHQLYIRWLNLHIAYQMVKI
jgi:hypothetical protein